MDIDYRIARASDIPALCKFTSGVASDTDYLPFTVSDTESDLSQGSYNVIGAFVTVIAITNGEVIGIAIVDRPSSLTRVKHRASFAVAVRKSFWGRGIASHLFEFASEEARAGGITKLTSEVLESNKRGSAFLIKHGFQKEGNEKSMMVIDGLYADGERYSIMLG